MSLINTRSLWKKRRGDDVELGLDMDADSERAHGLREVPQMERLVEDEPGTPSPDTSTSTLAEELNSLLLSRSSAKGSDAELEAADVNTPDREG